MSGALRYELQNRDILPAVYAADDAHVVVAATGVGAAVVERCRPANLHHRRMVAAGDGDAARVDAQNVAGLLPQVLITRLAERRDAHHAFLHGGARRKSDYRSREGGADRQFLKGTHIQPPPRCRRNGVTARPVTRPQHTDAYAYAHICTRYTLFSNLGQQSQLLVQVH